MTLPLLSLMTFLAAAPSGAAIDEGVEHAEHQGISRLREEARGRGGLSLAGSAAVGFATSAFAFGVGLSADAGLIFADRYAITLRLTGTLFLLLSAGLQFEVALTERLLFGVGASWGGFGGLDAPSASFVGVPVRVNWALSERERTAVARRGFALFAEVTPGFAYANSSGLASRTTLGIPLSIVAVVGIGYAWW